MARTLEERLRTSLAGTPLETRLIDPAAPLLEGSSRLPALPGLEGPVLDGLARVVATRVEAARYLAHRPALLERIAASGAGTLGARADELERSAPLHGEDLEGFLDWIRITRRDETLLAACLDLGGAVPFDEVSRFLSVLAETCVRWALDVAERAGGSGNPSLLSVLAVGKLAGRELTYHSDLDLIFLYPDEGTEAVAASRTGQRLIHYLTTMTGAGVAYAVDSRLRPSGRQGTLVSTYGAFSRYQCERAATWEHLALMRARPIAGDLPRAEGSLLTALAGAMRKASPWPEIAQMRTRVERERGHELPREVAFKSGAGGLMDVDFLAAGGMLERGVVPGPGWLPSVGIMLGTALASGPKLSCLLEAYDVLRRVAARTRWVTGRAAELLRLDAENADTIAMLIDPALDAAELANRIRWARETVRSACDAATEQGSIAAVRGCKMVPPAQIN